MAKKEALQSDENPSDERILRVMALPVGFRVYVRIEDMVYTRHGVDLWIASGTGTGRDRPGNDAWIAKWASLPREKKQ